MPLVFSKSKQGTVHYPQVQIQPLQIANMSGSMFLINTTKCGKCKGAK